MKKVLIFLLSLLMVCASLCGCGNGVDNIVLSTNAYEMKVGETYTLTYTVYPTSADNAEITWITSNASIATVNSDGEVYAVSCGQVNISASSSNGVVAVCSITVIEKPAYDRLNNDEKNLVDLLLSHIDEFKNPDSVVIKAAEKRGENEWTVKVSAQNGFGGNNVTVYYLDDLGFWNWDSLDIDLDVTINPDNSLNIDLINQAIEEARN